MRSLRLLAVVALCACGPSPKAPVKVMAIVPSVQGNYETRAVDLVTIESITALKGSILEMVGGARVMLDANDPLQNLNGGIGNLTDEQRYEVLVRDKGLDVRGDYIERGGVLWPADFHTWNMVSTYYNFERAEGYFRTLLAADPPELQKMKVLYWPEVHLNSADPLTDNALYLSFIKAFVIVPFKNQQKIPMAMNLGVIGHETSHKVFSKRVYQDQGIPDPLTLWNGPAFNLLKSLDEGLADFHGWGVTCLDVSGCKPSFLSLSISDAATIASRDVSRTNACLDENLRNAFQSFSPDQWVRADEMYKYGNLFAAALYQAGNKAGEVAALQKGLLAAYDDDSPATPGLNQLVNQNLNTPEAFTPEKVANAIVAHLPDKKLQEFACNELVDRLSLSCTTFPCPDLPACPPTASRTGTCPALAPP